MTEPGKKELTAEEVRRLYAERQFLGEVKPRLARLILSQDDQLTVLKVQLQQERETLEGLRQNVRCALEHLPVAPSRARDELEIGLLHYRAICQENMCT